ncbi:hypothetical protein RCH06_001413 [Polaromonas sp. CG_9.5]|uniref:ankyrin repeat domain-containing protein n=1 Tax=Polaromonas sp. CG_9.5 TaxID=3071705 RepID=UPI002DF7C6CE|nr:hypothetical protein [Polaromonas sp. CG_9.5]
MSAQDDELIRRYREASAQDASRPGPQVRAAVRAHAQMLVASKAAAGDKPAAGPVPVASRTAANASRWKISALGSVVLVGLSAMLLLQFERGTPEEQDIAYGPPRAEVSGAEERSEKPSAASVAPPSAANRDAPGGAAILKEHAADRMDAPQATPALNRAKALAKVAPSVAESKSASASSDTAALSGFPGSPSANADVVAVPSAAPPPAPTAEVAQRPSVQIDRAAKAASSSMAQTDPSVAAEAMTPPAAPAARSAQAAPDKRSGSDLNAANGKLSVPLPKADKRSASALEHALREAALAGRAEQVEELARQGVALDSRDSAGRTALMLAAMNGHTRVVQKLLALGANTALVDAQGQSAAQQAKRRGHTHIADLIDAGS